MRITDLAFWAWALATRWAPRRAHRRPALTAATGCSPRWRASMRYT
jgi:hypothetical protein